MALWQEFGDSQTPDAKFAAAMDRLQPLLQNYFTQGATWSRHGITSDRVLAKNAVIADGSEELWKLAESLIKEGVGRGVFETLGGGQQGKATTYHPRKNDLNPTSSFINGLNDSKCPLRAYDSNEGK